MSRRPSLAVPLLAAVRCWRVWRREVGGLGRLQRHPPRSPRKRWEARAETAVACSRPARGESRGGVLLCRPAADCATQHSCPSGSATRRRRCRRSWGPDRRDIRCTVRSSAVAVAGANRSPRNPPFLSETITPPASCACGIMTMVIHRCGVVAHALARIPIPPKHACAVALCACGRRTASLLRQVLLVPMDDARSDHLRAPRAHLLVPTEPGCTSAVASNYRCGAFVLPDH